MILIVTFFLTILILSNGFVGKRNFFFDNSRTFHRDLNINYRTTGLKSIPESNFKEKYIRKSVVGALAFLFTILPVAGLHGTAYALNMGTVFEREGIMAEDDDTKFDFMDFFKQLTSGEDDSEESESVGNSEGTMEFSEQIEDDSDSTEKVAIEGIPKESYSSKRKRENRENNMKAESFENSLPPISQRQIDRMIRSGIDGVGMNRNRPSPYGFNLEDSDSSEEDEILVEGEGRKNPPAPGLPTEEFLEEKAMFEEVIGEIMASGEISGIYDVQFTPIDSTVIPFITTVTFLYFWLKQGTDDEMPQYYDSSKIDGYFVSQPLIAIQRTMEIAAGMLELAIIRQSNKINSVFENNLTPISNESTSPVSLVASELTMNMTTTEASIIPLAVTGSSSSSSSSSSIQSVQQGYNPRNLEDNLSKSREIDLDTAVRFRQVLGSLGPTFIKLGQALANRPDLVGRATATELTLLQDRLPPFPYEEVCKIMERELGKPPHLLFDEFSPTPVAAGSLGQVHKARIGNEWLAVKVKRPGVLDEIGKDLYILRQAVALLPMPVDLPSVVDDYGQALMEEIDYRREVENMIRFRKLYGRTPRILVPRVMTDYCSDSIITMEWVDGERIVQRSLSVSKEDLPLLETGIKLTLRQLLEVGFLHADPHGGNLLKTHENPSRLAYLDFGIVTEVAPVVRDSILRAVLYLVNGDFENLAKTFPGLLLIPEAEVIDRLPQFETALRKLFGPLLAEAKAKGEIVPRLPFGALLEQLFDIAQSFRFTIPPYFLSNVRALAELEGLAITADSNYNLLSSVYPFAVQRMLVDQDATLRGALEQLIFDPEEGLRTEVLRSIFGLIMPTYTPRPTPVKSKLEFTTEVPKASSSANQDVITVAPTREQYAFVQRVLVKLLVARVWSYISTWIDDCQSKLPKSLKKGLPEKKRSLDPLEGQASYSTIKLLKQIAQVRPAGLTAAFRQSLMLCRVFFIVFGKLTVKFCKRNWNDMKGILERLVEIGIVGFWSRAKTLWSYWRA